MKVSSLRHEMAGGAGYISSHMALELLDEDVVVLDTHWTTQAGLITRFRSDLQQQLVQTKALFEVVSHRVV